MRAHALFEASAARFYIRFKLPTARHSQYGFSIRPWFYASGILLAATLIAGFNIQSDVRNACDKTTFLNSFVSQSHASCDVAMELNIEKLHFRQLFESCVTPPRHTESAKSRTPKTRFSISTGSADRFSTGSDRFRFWKGSGKVLDRF